MDTPETMSPSAESGHRVAVPGQREPTAAESMAPAPIVTSGVESETTGEIPVVAPTMQPTWASGWPPPPVPVPPLPAGVSRDPSAAPVTAPPVGQAYAPSPGQGFTPYPPVGPPAPATVPVTPSPYPPVAFSPAPYSPAPYSPAPYPAAAAYPTAAYPAAAYPAATYPVPSGPPAAAQTFPPSVFQAPGPLAGYPSSGSPTTGVPQSGFPQSGSPQSGVPQFGVPQSGSPQSGSPQSGSPQSGVPQFGVPQPGVPQSGVPQSGFGPPRSGQPGFGQPGSGAPGAPPSGYPPAGPTGYPQHWAPPPNRYGQPVNGGRYDPNASMVYYQPSQQPPRKRGRAVPIVATLAILLLVVCLGAGGYGVSRVLRDDNATANSQAGTHVPGQTSPTSGTVPNAGGALDDVLAAQSAALLRGDEKGWLAAVDPKEPAAVASYLRLFRNMHAMKVAAWSQTAVDDTAPLTSRRAYEINVSYCLVVTTCTNTKATLHITAQKHGATVLIESYVTPKASRYSSEPFPWEVSSLQAVVGKRVVVAASSAWAWKLPSTLPIAERAAEAADKYALWGKPSEYVVYLADPSEGKTWFDGDLKDVDGVSYTIESYDIEIVIMMPTASETRYAGPGALNAVIQHEMGHVVSLQGNLSDIGHDSFVEGIAEYISYTGHPGWARYRIDDVRAYVRGGKWNKHVFLTSQITSRSVLAASAAYGIGYLTMRHLAERYGTAKMLDFWGNVERDGESLDDASRQNFGSPWTSVNNDCVAYIRSASGA